MRLKLSRREGLLLGLVALAALIWLWHPFGGEGPAPTPQSPSRPEGTLAPIPRIDLARLEVPPAEVEIGQRDLFAYGPPRPSAAAVVPEATPAPAPRPVRPPTVDPSRARSARSESSLPPMNLKFIGSVGTEQGVTVAVLVTERNEVLTGRPGDVIANRYRIERIGIESVDIADVGTGQSRRIPLKGD